MAQALSKLWIQEVTVKQFKGMFKEAKNIKKTLSKKIKEFLNVKGEDDYKEK